jgi:hypothetical protein
MKHLKRFSKIRIFPILFLSATLFQVAVADDDEDAEKSCVRPLETPSIPDGRRSTPQEMTDAMHIVRDYLAANATYRECVAKLMQKDADTASEATLKAAQALIEETIETDELVGDLFNQQVRIHKSSNSEF